MILVTGANGQLGSEIRDIAKQNEKLQFVFTDVNELDISDFVALENFISANKFDFIVNCAAYTAVDKAETDKENAYKVNVTAVKNLAQISAKYQIKFIHVSTDYVFDGSNHIPYKEDEPTCPTSVYGQSKLDGETEVLNSDANALIIRTSWLYSSVGNNFAKTIKRLASQRNELTVIFDQIGTPTYAGDLADAIVSIINQSIDKPENFKTGIYHFSNEGVCSWYDFAVEIVKFCGLNCKVKPIESKDFPTPTKRPHYSVLNKAKIKATFNLTIPYWRDSMEVCLRKLI